ncbi:MAG: 4Fe-4S binding protein [Candidatus Aminicenantes bacterium]|nr:4Fe-4S binding protein [Candidatus Aminicenantes bacterium]
MSLSVNSEECKGCGLCVSVCPAQAVSIIDNKAYIDQDKCTECLLCLDECPTGAIHRISEKELSLADRERINPYFSEQIILPPKPSISSYKEQKRPATTASMFLGRLRSAVSAFLDLDSSPGTRRRGGRMKHQRQRRRQRGRRS